AVAVLGAEALCADDEHAVLRQPAPREGLQPGAYRRRQRARTAHVEAQLDRRRDLVHVLAARAGSAHKALLQLVLVERQFVGDAQSRHRAEILVLAAPRLKPSRRFARGAVTVSGRKDRAASP